MSLRKRFLLAMLFAVVALGAAGRGRVYKAESGVPRASRSFKAFRTERESLPALFLPIQFRDPKNLGVGKVLVAARGLGDPHFAQTVILLVHYDEKGVLGLALNRRTDVPLSRVLNLEAAKDRSDPVYLGGPVEPSAAFALLQSSARIEKAEKIFGGVYMISDKILFEQTMLAKPDPGVFHVYLGYAGWTQDQLRAEVQLGAWFIFPADAATVFNSDPDSLWLQMIHKTELQMAENQPSRETFPPPAQDLGAVQGSVRMRRFFWHGDVEIKQISLNVERHFR